MDGNVRQAIDEAIKQAANQYYRLVLLVGRSGSGKTGLLQSVSKEKGYPLVNVNLSISQKMLELTKGQRSKRVERLFKELLDGLEGDVVLLDNLELLFEPTLEIDPLRLLQMRSRNRTLVVSWNGTFENDALNYAESGHPEYQSYRQVDALVIPMHPST